ncbi:ectonucleotide pyrophosphatase/phosphodiesterase family member 5-like [Pecten maximus]|uniref:ectonucleotide pyrophosphatase/phosphodiesterase family member 5-like n=1 Tax=Pecten maximus TaxID=6579 RepID=UPI001457ED2F|nr:ectonucleotide pyrophosphatase/phosphodiesterase family member 5-like [Pecten maximus]
MIRSTSFNTMVRTSPCMFLLVLIMVCFTGEVVSGKRRTYAKQVLLVSMDGFRYDYPKKVATPNFDRMERYGVKAKYITNAFPTKTFPCHYSTITGLHAESHGIVGNTMYDPEFDEFFSMRSHQTKWWDAGEPLWITARKQGLTSGTMFWPGSEAEIQGLRPNRWYKYNESITYDERVDIVINMLKVDKLNFVTLYFHQPDLHGHIYGPNSPEVVDKIVEMDTLLGTLLHKLVVNGLRDEVNLIVLSDHGMTEVDYDNKLVEIWDLVDKSLIQRTVDSGPIMHVVPAVGQEDAVLSAINSHPHFTAYRKADIPDRWHYQNNRRIMPIFVVADEGWTITWDRNYTRRYDTKGSHGYDNRLITMKSIFYAIGPNFKPKFSASPFKSVDVYPLVCELLGMRPSPNNGSLHNTAGFLKPYRDYRDFFTSGGYNLLGVSFMQATGVNRYGGPVYDSY